MQDTAYLYSEGRYTKFEHNGTVLTFIAPYSLEKYIKILKWDSGYIEVLTQYNTINEPVEEYIDLVPIIKNLSMQDDFLRNVKNVEVDYDRLSKSC